MQIHNNYLWPFNICASNPATWIPDACLLACHGEWNYGLHFLLLLVRIPLVRSSSTFKARPEMMVSLFDATGSHERQGNPDALLAALNSVYTKLLLNILILIVAKEAAASLHIVTGPLPTMPHSRLLLVHPSFYFADRGTRPNPVICTVSQEMPSAIPPIFIDHIPSTTNYGADARSIAIFALLLGVFEDCNQVSMIRITHQLCNVTEPQWRHPRGSAC